MHLLVVEDDPRLGRLLKRLLTDERHLVELTASGEEALDIAELGDGIDAMVLDIGLPDIPGTEVARRLRAKGSTVPILMLTARDAIDDRVRGLDAGARTTTSSNPSPSRSCRRASAPSAAGPPVAPRPAGSETGRSCSTSRARWSPWMASRSS
jgi:two-component system OmpR family response regulator